MASHCCVAQTSLLVKVGFIKDLAEKKSDKIQVINFWATWCAPCIKEMPLFEKLNETRSDVQVTLVSVDLNLDPNPAKIHKFVERKKLKSTVYILDERDPNVWIDVIEKSWEGAIPATLIVNTNTGKRNFVDKELHEGELEKLIDQLK
jgi:thiol-disulfide isomerase/thioredoxin